MLETIWQGSTLIGIEDEAQNTESGSRRCVDCSNWFVGQNRSGCLLVSEGLLKKECPSTCRWYDSTLDEF